MPVKKIDPPLTGPTLSVEDVFLVDELVQLAKDWAKEPYLFGTQNLRRYQELCAYFGTDGTSLLFGCQTRDASLDQTGIMPAIGDSLPGQSELTG
jgi:hypothetical protein